MINSHENDVCQAYLQYKKVGDIMSEFNLLSCKDLYKILKKYNIPLRKKFSKSRRSKFIITKDKVEEIKSLFIQDFSIKKIAEHFDAPEVIISKICKDNNLCPKNCTFKQKYSLNQDFFEKIDKPEKAQFLGLLFADGYVNIKNNQVCVKLSEIDKEYLDKVKGILECDRPLYYTKPTSFISPSNGRQYTQAGSYNLTISNKKFTKDALSLGLHSQKTFTDFSLPDIPNNFLNSFVLGYFEGDGWITLKKKICALGRRQAIFGIIGQYSILKDFKTIMESELGITLNLRQTPDKYSIKLYTLTTSKKENLIKIYNWLYKDAPFYMGRKHTLWQEFLSSNPQLKLEN